MVNNTKNETSETLRNEIILKTTHISPISDHVPKHRKPLNDEQFGHYLAGFIDSNGDFSYSTLLLSNSPQLIIGFNSSDAYLAYYLRGKIGYGKVKKVKDNNTFLLINPAK